MDCIAIKEMTDWRKSDQGNDNKVKGMAVRVREEFGMGKDCEAKVTDWPSTWTLGLPQMMVSPLHLIYLNFLSY